MRRRKCRSRTTKITGRGHVENLEHVQDIVSYVRRCPDETKLLRMASYVCSMMDVGTLLLLHLCG